MRTAWIVLALAGCSTSHATDTGPDYRNAHLSPACAPDDGPAVSLRVFFAAPCSGLDCAPACGGAFDGQTVEVLVYDGASTVLPLTAGETIVSGVAAPNGVVTICPGRGMPCEVTSEFVLRIDATGAGLTTGRLDYGTRGGFSTVVAEECPGTPSCG